MASGRPRSPGFGKSHNTFCVLGRVISRDTPDGPLALGLPESYFDSIENLDVSVKATDTPPKLAKYVDEEPVYASWSSRSSAGGAVFFAGSLVKIYSRRIQTICLFSAETEVHALG